MKTSRKKPIDIPLLVRLKKEGMSDRAIAQKQTERGFPCCHRTVQERWKEVVKKSGKSLLPVKRDTRKLGDRTRRWLARRVTQPSPPSGRELLEDLQRMGKEVHRKTVWEALASNPHLRAKRPQKGLYLTQANRRQRKQWAREHLRAGTDWTKVMFSDEKLFFLDGPTVRPQVWMDTRVDPVTFGRIGDRNAPVCVWGAFSVEKVPEVVCIRTHFDSHSFCEALTEALLPFMPVDEYTLCFDRHPSHKSVFTQRWLAAHSVKTMLLPPKAADMNPIETLWARMTRLVYGQTKVYTDLKVLEKRIKEAWKELREKKEEREKLVGGLPGRLRQVVAKKGGFVKD